jgi:GGDEF domain-containing protein
MNDIIIETLIAISSVAVCWTLYRAEIKYQVTSQPGSKLILLGFGLLCLSFIIDVTDNFPELDRFVVIGDTSTQAFIEKVIGSLAGLIALAIGFHRWLPSVLELAIARNNLSRLNNSLEQLVDERTAELCSVNTQLRIEINQREQTQLQLTRQKYQDLLTQLPNRYALLEYLSDEKNHQNHHNQYHAVFLIDINNFKSINDSFGHSYGDKVLVAIANRLAFNHRTEDYLARLGGDEFMLVIPSLQGNIQQLVLKPTLTRLKF